MRRKKFFSAILLSLVICLTTPNACPAYAAGAAPDSQSLVQAKYNLSPESMSFLRDHNVDFSVFKADSISAHGSETEAVPFSMEESILGLIQETDAYGFTDEQIQQYVDGLVNSDTIIAASDNGQAYAVTTPPMSTRNSDGPGFEVKSKSGYSQSTAFVTLPTAYNAGNSNSWMFYTISSPTSNWGIDVGVSKRAVKENQKGKRGQKSLDVWNDSGAFETRSGYRPVRKQLRHLEDFPAFAENTCCGVPE